MADRPATYTADRADRVTAGMFVHRQIPLLSEPAPADGWEAVTDVLTDVAGTLIGVAPNDVWSVMSDRIVYMGPVG